MMVGRLLSFSDGIFSGAMLNFQGVSVLFFVFGTRNECSSGQWATSPDFPTEGVPTSEVGEGAGEAEENDLR